MFGIIREKAWHKTIVSNNALPTTSAVKLHCHRISTVLKLNSSATSLNVERSSYTEMGWKLVKIEEKELLVPQWDTTDSCGEIKSVMQTLLKKCCCKKSKCLNRLCKCKSSNSFCSNLCLCKNCENVPSTEAETEDIDTDDDDIGNVSDNARFDESSDEDTSEHTYADDNHTNDKLTEIFEIVNDEYDEQNEDDELLDALIA